MSLKRLDKLDHSLLVNGNFDYSQRGGSFTAVSDQFIADRFKFYSQAGVFDTLAADNKLRITATTGTGDITGSTDTSIQLEQRIEGLMLRRAINGKVTVLFNVKSKKIGKTCVTLLAFDGTNYKSMQGQFEILQTETLERKAIQFDLSAMPMVWVKDSNKALHVTFHLAKSDDIKSTNLDAWEDGVLRGHIDDVNLLLSDDDYVEFSEMSMLEGEFSTDTGFCYAGRDVFEELSLCQRYFEKSAPQSEPYTSSYSAEYGKAASDGRAFRNVKFASTKRDIPVVTFYPGTESHLTSIYEKENSFRITGDTLSGSKEWLVIWTADAEL